MQKRNFACKYEIEINERNDYDRLKDYLKGLRGFKFFISEKIEDKIKIVVQYTRGTPIAQNQLPKNAKIQPLLMEIKKFKSKVLEMKNSSSFMECEPEEEIPNEKTITIEELEAMSPEELKKLPMSSYGTVKQLERAKKNNFYTDDMDEIMAKPVKVYYIWGESGIGKTQMAKRMIRNWLQEYYPDKAFNSLTYVNTFWEGVGDDAIAAIFDDFRCENMTPQKFINFIDYNITNMNIKGGERKNLYKLIIITSIENPFKIYANYGEKKRQWLRRMEKIHVIAKTELAPKVPDPKEFKYGEEKVEETVEIGGESVEKIQGPFQERKVLDAWNPFLGRKREVRPVFLVQPPKPEEKKPEEPKEEPKVETPKEEPKKYGIIDDEEMDEILEDAAANGKEEELLNQLCEEDDDEDTVDLGLKKNN